MQISFRFSKGFCWSLGSLFLLVGLSTSLRGQVQPRSNAGAKAPDGLVRCATVDMMNAMRSRGEWPESEMDFERWMAAKQAESLTHGRRNSALSPGQESPEIIYTIPVVVHIIYQNETDVWNISDQQVISQIQVLNEDFRRLNADTVNTPALFTGVAGYPNIEFCLARRDTLGQNTTGIVRHRFQQQATWSTNTFNSTVKPATRWNPNLYYNIWIANLSGGVLGYAQFPTGSTLQGLSGGTNGLFCFIPVWGGLLIIPSRGSITLAERLPTKLVMLWASGIYGVMVPIVMPQIIAGIPHHQMRPITDVH